MNDLTMEQSLRIAEDRISKLEEKHAALQVSSNELRIVVGGEPLTGKPGVLQNQVRMINALFDEKEGVVPRLTSMERRELERAGWVKGANFAWGITGTVIGALLMYLI